MKKIFAYIAISMLLLMLIPITSGMSTNQKPETKPLGVNWAFVRGIITRPDYFNGGNSVTFRAIYVHYKTHGFGISKEGVLHGLQKIVLPNDYIGILNHHNVFAKFNGRMEIQ